MYLTINTVILILIHSVHFSAGLDIYTSKERTRNFSCWMEGANKHCNSLSLSLEELQHQNYSTLWLQPGEYALPDKQILQDSSEGQHSFLWAENIAIRCINHDLQTGDQAVIIRCKIGFGLSFVYATNVSLSGIRFVGCGALQYTTSAPNYPKFEKATFALYFLYCRTINLQNVAIHNTPGTGMVLYGTTGQIEITNSSFVSNSVKDNHSGGGGLYIEFPYCGPTLYSSKLNCSEASNVPSEYVSNCHYYISNCDFVNNTAKVKNVHHNTFILPQRETHLALGRGGGLSVFFKGLSRENSITVFNSKFIGNKALWGGGVLVEHQDNSSHNIFLMDTCYVGNNRVLYSDDPSKGTGGGGVRVGFIFFYNSYVISNNITFKRVTFDRNKAYFGGGSSFYTAKETKEWTVTNVLHFSNCSWTFNTARVGSAVDLMLWHASHDGVAPKPVFKNCMFIGNNAAYSKSPGSKPLGVGSVYADSIQIHFQEFVKFESNEQSALASIGAKVFFDPGCFAFFINNTGRNGGAIALLGMSYLVVSRHTELYFNSNSAEVKGGAIYGYSIGNHDLISSRNCFIQYAEGFGYDPHKWLSTFSFVNNTANSESNSIYGTSLLSCIWGSAYGITTRNTNTVFCWNNSNNNKWYYSTGCHNEIESAPGRLYIPSSVKLPLTFYPGIAKELPFEIRDDMNHDVLRASVLTATIAKRMDTPDTHIDSTSLFISDNTLKLHGMPSSNATVLLETIAPRVISHTFKVKFLECPIGMSYNPTNETGCYCERTELYGGLVKCDGYERVKLLRGAWFGLDKHLNYVAGLSPYMSPAINGNRYKLLQKRHVDLCLSVNRTGSLCGHCLPGYGTLVNGGGLKCHKCTPKDMKYHWLFYLFTEFFPIFVFFIIIVLFNVNATSGPANSFVFFAQVLTSVFKIDGDGVIQLHSITNHANALRSFYVILYDIWNQNFIQPLLPSFCLSSKITTLQILSTGYLTALFPLLLVLGFSSLVWAHGRGYTLLVYLSYPFLKLFAKYKKIWNLQTSLVNAFATFILLSYTKFALVSFVVLKNVPLYNSTSVVKRVLYYDGTIDYLGPRHIPYVIASAIAFLTFVTLPPIILISPSLILVVKKIGKRFKVNCRGSLPSFLVCGPLLSQFLNVFHGCYKDGTGADNGTVDYRWFAGLYFFLRMILFMTYAFSPNWFFQFVVQQLICLLALQTFIILQPYKNKILNFVDATFFAILAAISTLSMYNYYLTKTNQDLSHWAFGIQYILIVIPLFYASSYCVYVMWKKINLQHLFLRRREERSAAPEDNDQLFLEFTDNEKQYRAFSGSYKRRPQLWLTANSSRQFTLKSGN